ncbi:MAG TPA: MGMT family protein [Armatimonadota bacterium]|nr:MGMT family protein [Armatimonadota bacterium]
MAEEEQPAKFLNCFEHVYDIVREIPYGKVMTYGQIADMLPDVCTAPVPAVQVGRAMAASGRYAPDIPWWRVIGQLGEHGVLRKASKAHVQHEMLATEGVLPDAEGRYDLAKYRYVP